MSGLRSRRKGVRVELSAKLIGGRKVSRAYQAGHDLELLLGDDRLLRIECKARADGFRELYSWLDEREVLIINSDRREPLAVMRLSLAAEIANAAASDVLDQQHGQDKAGPLRDSLEDAGTAK